MTTEGYVKLPRTMLEWGWLDDGNTVRVYLVLLLSANWKDTEWHGIKLKRGQLITGRKQLAEKCHLSEQEIRTALKHLKSTNEITIEAKRQFSIITINDYDPDRQDNQQINQPLTNSQPTTNQSPTNDQPIANQALTTVEERKEEKEIKEKQEREEAAAPPASPSRFNSSNSFDKAVTKDDLTAKYGEESVTLYEMKFDSWAAKKGISDFSNMYGVIAKWLVEDNVPKKRESSFDMDEVRQRIIGRYIS